MIHRIRRFLRRTAIAVVLAVWPLATHAVQPTTEAGKLCGGFYVIVGRVLSASALALACQRSDGMACRPNHALQLKVYVVRLLTQANTWRDSRLARVLRMGEVIDVIAPSGHEDTGNDQLSDRLPSKEQLAAAYAGKEFIMAVNMSDWWVNHRSEILVHLWPMSAMEFARTTLSEGRADCPALL